MWINIIIIIHFVIILNHTQQVVCEVTNTNIGTSIFFSQGNELIHMILKFCKIKYWDHLLVIIFSLYSLEMVSNFSQLGQIWHDWGVLTLSKVLMLCIACDQINKEILLWSGYTTENKWCFLLEMLLILLHTMVPYHHQLNTL